MGPSSVYSRNKSSDIASLAAAAHPPPTHPKMTRAMAQYNAWCRNRDATWAQQSQESDFPVGGRPSYPNRYDFDNVRESYDAPYVVAERSNHPQESPNTVASSYVHIGGRTYTHGPYRPMREMEMPPDNDAFRTGLCLESGEFLPEPCRDVDGYPQRNMLYGPCDVAHTGPGTQVTAWEVSSGHQASHPTVNNYPNHAHPCAPAQQHWGPMVGMPMTPSLMPVQVTLWPEANHVPYPDRQILAANAEYYLEQCRITDHALHHLEEEMARRAQQLLNELIIEHDQEGTSSGGSTPMSPFMSATMYDSARHPDGPIIADGSGVPRPQYTTYFRHRVAPRSVQHLEQGAELQQVNTLPEFLLDPNRLHTEFLYPAPPKDFRKRSKSVGAEPKEIKTDSQSRNDSDGTDECDSTGVGNEGDMINEHKKVEESEEETDCPPLRRTVLPSW